MPSKIDRLGMHDAAKQEGGGGVCSARRPPVLINWRDVSAASALDPLRFLEAPGTALVRQNLAWLRTETNPVPTHLDRIAAARPRAIFANFPIARLSRALSACQHLAALGCRPVAVRGRLIPAEARSDFLAISFANGLLPLLSDADVDGISGEPWPAVDPAAWALPVVAVEVWHPQVSGVRLGALFSRAPDPADLDLRDLMEREGAAPPRPRDVSGLLDGLASSGLHSALVVAGGEDATGLAETAHRQGRLGGWLGRASVPVPEVVRRSGCPVWHWFTGAELPERPVENGVAFVPVGLDGEGIPEATVRLLRLRELGYMAIVPRFDVPSPNARAWQDLEVRYGLRPVGLDRLGGEHLVFNLTGWGSAEGPELLEIWRRGNRWPVPRAASGHRRSVSFEAVRQVIDDYLVDTSGRITSCHVRDLFASVLDTVRADGTKVEELDRYPFVAVGGRSLLELVQEAIEARLLSLGDLPAELLGAIRHAALAGGKRIRPVLTLTLATALGVPLDAAMPAALATEWLHTASLIQDDLPCMDDDDIRRRDVSTHRRHGEAIALLASDALIAMALEDVAALAQHPRVGPERTARIVVETARALGSHGLVGGQVRDLLTRRLAQVTLQDVLEVHRRKTVPLFRITAVYAAILADLPEQRASELVAMLESLGLAFQIVDDVLDATPGNETFGRPPGSDVRNERPTFATLMSGQAGRRYAKKLMDRHLANINGRPSWLGLQRLTTYVLERAQ